MVGLGFLENESIKALFQDTPDKCAPVVLQPGSKWERFSDRTLGMSLLVLQNIGSIVSIEPYISVDSDPSRIGVFDNFREELLLDIRMHIHSRSLLPCGRIKMERLKLSGGLLIARQIERPASIHAN